ncbi:MAG: hypothetical protein CW716_04525 [Candidatus Bathyarchaeum sp.]|nr:MAG: hypothetical protein CW716_04525 [Candidatus Bathyarchaeum sp.]
MNLLEVIFWGIPCVTAFMISLILGYGFYRERNRQKLIFSIGIALVGIAHINFMLENLEGVTLFQNVYWLFVPVACASSIATFSGFLKVYRLRSFMIFLFVTVASLLLFFSSLIPEIFAVVLMTVFSVFISVPLLSYLIVKNRELVDCIFLLANLCFIFEGVVRRWGLSSETPYLLSFFGMVFVSLMFTIPSKSNSYGVSSFFLLAKKLESTEEDLRLTQEKLLQSERLAAIGELAGMVGHDIRNPLQGITNATFFLKEKVSSKINEEELEIFDIIDGCVEDANKIVNDLLEYSKDIHLKIEETSPTFLIESSIDQIVVPDLIKIVLQLQNEKELSVDKGKIVRVFANLIKNAIDAMPDGGQLTIRTEKTNDGILFSFEDMGVGMSTEILSNLWRPLFTTKAKGMGFGLCVCKRFVEAHGGTINAKSEEAKGSTFEVKLPLLPNV